MENTLIKKHLGVTVCTEIWSPSKNGVSGLFMAYEFTILN